MMAKKKPARKRPAKKKPLRVRTNRFDKEKDLFVSVITCVRIEDLKAACIDGLKWWDRQFPGQHSTTLENQIPMPASDTPDGPVTHRLCFMPDVPWETAENFAETAAEWGTPAIIEFGHMTPFLRRKRLHLLRAEDIEWYQRREFQNEERIKHERRIDLKSARKKREKFYRPKQIARKKSRERKLNKKGQR